MLAERAHRVMMLGTFGLRPKATLRARALAIAHTLSPDEWSFDLVTTPWDCPKDAGNHWIENGVPVINTRVSQPAAFPLATIESVRHVRATHPHLIHLFKPKGFGDISARWLRRTLPIVVDMDDWEGNGGWNEIGGYNRLQRRLFDWQERTWPRQAVALTVASRELERRALDLGANPQRIHYVPNGLTEERFTHLASSIRVSAEVTDRPTTMLLYTRFVEFKPQFVVQVLAGVRRVIPNAMLRIVGRSLDGRAEIDLSAAANSAGVADAIIWHGWAQPAEIPEIAAACDIAIHPFDDNNVNRAKCSVKLLELMATGIPTVTTAVGENASFIEDGISGRLTPPGEPAMMANAVLDLLRQRAYAEQLGRMAQERVKTHYLWERLARRIADAYHQALAERAGF